MSVRFPETRWSLIRRLGDRPEDAATLVDLYCDGIVRYLRRRLDHDLSADDVDDIAHEVLVQLLEHPEVLAQARPGPGSRFRYLLMTVAYNAARNVWRARRRNAARTVATEHPDRTEPGAEAAAAPEPEALRAMDRAWAESLLTSAWNDVRGLADERRLEPEAVAILEDSLVRGIGLRRIAQARGLTLPTCQRRFARARTYLQQAITARLRQAGELPPGADPASACDLLLDVLRR